VAFVLPTFNVTCNIYTINFPPPAGPPRLADVPCQLRAPSANNILIVSSLQANSAMVVLLPPLTDIRDAFSPPINNRDWIEVPAGTGRYYTVIYVDDIGKGFPNEHRFAILHKMTAIPWPVPIP